MFSKLLNVLYSMNKMQRIYATIGASIVFLILIVPIVAWTGGTFEKATFPKPAPVTYTKGMTESDKCGQLVSALTHQMRYEINDSLFGWTANAVLINHYLLDNRVNRQLGVYIAFQELFSAFSIDMATLGSNDEENRFLKEARKDYFNGGAEKIIQFPGFVSKCDTGFKLTDKYVKAVAEGKATFNIKSDDIYEAFNVMLGPKVLGKAISLLHDAQTLPSYELDNRIYQAQGICLVVRDFANALYVLYPQFSDKNNEENMLALLEHLNAICTYNPLYISGMWNSGDKVIAWLLFTTSRMNDILKSIKI